MRKKRLLYLGLALVLVNLVLARYRQMKRPLYPDIVSINDNRRNMALARLRTLPSDKKLALREELRPSLSDADANVRRYALYTIRKINMPDQAMAEMVTPLMKDTDASVREEAIAALVDTGALGINEGIKSLANANGIEATAAATYFERLGPEHLPELMSVLTLSGTDEGKRVAALTVVKMSPNSSQVLPVFLDILKKRFDVDIVKALITLGPAAKPAAPLLQKYLATPSDSLLNEDAPRPLSARALQAVDPRPAAINNLSWDLKNKDPLIRYRAVTTWGRKKDLDVSAIPAMVNVLRDADLYVAARAAEVLVRLDLKNVAPMGKVAYPALKDVNQRVNDQKVEGFRERVGAQIDALFQSTQR